MKLHPTKIQFILLTSIWLYGCQTLSTNYVARWVDFEEWGKLQLNMSKNEVLELLGEPYMTTRGQIVLGVNSVTYIYKFRTKLYKSLEVSKKETKTSWDPRDNGASAASSSSMVSNKPAKFDTTHVWGNIYDVYLTFENNKLTSWFCPQLKNSYKIESDSTRNIQLQNELQY